jgi:DNA-binding winged helix-turn-helix (wHTH) protein
MSGGFGVAEKVVSAQIHCCQAVKALHEETVERRDRLDDAFSSRSMEPVTAPDTLRFGPFELHVRRSELRREGRRIKLQPQPFRLLVLLVTRAGMLVTRDEIRDALWPDGTYVDFDQAVNFSVRQVRDALGDSAERPVFIETVPRRGYRFVAPVEPGERRADEGPTVRLQKALWQNVAELRLAEARRQRYVRLALLVAAVILSLAALTVFWR